ncbi:MAG: hypothetical protein JO077_10445 [Verrucomicrobia bacterium]|nr:hypothetical protein [Verrucomicrobiota bacterium]
MIERILHIRGLAQNLSVQDVAEMINRFSSTIQNLFAPTSILVETPFRQFNSDGHLRFYRAYETVSVCVPDTVEPKVEFSRVPLVHLADVCVGVFCTPQKTK